MYWELFPMCSDGDGDEREPQTQALTLCTGTSCQDTMLPAGLPTERGEDAFGLRLTGQDPCP